MTFMNFLYGLIVLILAFTFQTTLTGINRKVTARLQKRYGARWYQQFLDIFKALRKSSISHGWVYDFGVVMALGGIMATVILTPVAGFESFPNMDNVFIISYLLAVGMLGMAMSAAGSGNPWASIGVSRALTNMLAYDVPLMIVIFTLIFANDTASVSE
jgi:NADH-quinone oxidoreductase subunit H